MKHPYEEYEASKLWMNVKSSVEDLVENNDIITFNSDRVYRRLYLQKYICD